MVKLGFIMEQALGHVTHHQNLARWVAEDPEVTATWMPIPEQNADLWERLPGIRSNWSLKASLRARDQLRAKLQTESLEALFWHTQTTALFSGPFMRNIPSVVSLDATPINYDTVGAAYNHVPSGNRWLEQRKHKWHSQTFHGAHSLVSWCQWAKDSLVRDYGVSPQKVTVIPPGVDLEKWSFGLDKAERMVTAQGPVRLLFVGGDFARKGGPTLVEAFRNGLQEICTLDIVTKDAAVEQEYSGVRGLKVHRGLTANSAPLKELYANSDLFVFPTLADCLPIAVMEAMAAGLPVIATNVGALPEEVEDGVTGLTVPPSDAVALVAAVRALVTDSARRRLMSAAGRHKAEEQFDARRNYNQIIALLKQCALEGRSSQEHISSARLGSKA